jgi:hypothetical protein
VDLLDLGRSTKIAKALLDHSESIGGRRDEAVRDGLASAFAFLVVGADTCRG